MSSSHARTSTTSGPGAPADAGDSIRIPRGAWIRLGLICAVLLGAGLALIPVDGPISDAAIAFRDGALGGDVERELEALQQYGQGSVTLLVAWAIWLLDPARRRRLLDLLAGVAIAAAVAFPLKMLVGRPRPKFGDPEYFCGPFGAYPLGPDVGVRHAWEVWAGISSDLWSVPSSHTVYAVVLSVFLAVVYPRLRPLAIVMACLVAVARVIFGAHYLSDVFIGAALGLAIAWPAVRLYLGVRAVDWIWARLVDRGARPALPGVLAVEAGTRGRGKPGQRGGAA